jgi:hypothetical protein
MLIDLLEESTNGKKCACEVEVNEGWIHKASILKQVFAKGRVFKDRRVHGLLKSMLDKSTYIDLEDVLLKGDNVVFYQNKKPALGCIVEILKGLKKVHVLPNQELKNETTILKIKKLKTHDTVGYI